jgi:hypothetical protein
MRWLCAALLVLALAGCATISKAEANRAASTATGEALAQYLYEPSDVQSANDQIDVLISVRYWTFEARSGCGNRPSLFCNEKATAVTVAVAAPYRVLTLFAHRIECKVPPRYAAFASLGAQMQQQVLQIPNKIYRYLASQPGHPSYDVGPAHTPDHERWICNPATSS